MVNNEESRPVLAFLTSHWLSIIGSTLATIAGCAWVFAMVLGGRSANPYVGILITFVIPALFIAGLVLIPIGAWLARKQIQAGLAVVQSRRIVLRRLAIFFGVMTVVNVVITSQVTYKAVGQMESDQFCGQSCHVMKPQFVANQRSVHRNVDCVACHVVPGAAGFMAAKINGSKQLLEVTMKTYPRPIPPALQSGRLVASTETCEQCHARATNLGTPMVVISKFKDDEANTPTQSVLMMNVGGGRFGGIHGAHMGPGVEIRYRADRKRQTVSTVEYTNSVTHETRTYKAAKDTGGEEFVMECADCHNRQGHSFEQPDEAVDHAMASGDIPTGLPFAHKTAVEILKASTAADGIPAAFSAFYKQKYPDVAAKRAADIDKAGKVIQSLYERNVYPDLGIKWGTYPSNLGHADNAGCFRCHDESHVSSATGAKKTISQDCSLCHNPLAVDETNPAILKTLGLDTKLTSLLKQ